MPDAVIKGMGKLLPAYVIILPERQCNICPVSYIFHYRKKILAQDLRYFYAAHQSAFIISNYLVPVRSNCNGEWYRREIIEVDYYSGSINSLAIYYAFPKRNQAIKDGKHQYAADEMDRDPIGSSRSAGFNTHLHLWHNADLRKLLFHILGKTEF